MPDAGPFKHAIRAQKVPPDVEIAELAERQRGVVAHRQLVQMGLGRGEIWRRLDAGRLHPLHRGVYAVGHRRLPAGGHWMAAGLACGAVNGFFVAYVGMSSFVVTLGMMSIARSLAVVFSGNQMLYKFGPDAPIVKAIGQGKFPSGHPDSIFPHWIPAFSSHFWTMVVLALIVGYVFNFKAWGKHLYAIGGNEEGARMTGVDVDRIKFQAYVFSAFTASLAAILILGYSGSAINALGQTYELRVIAATVIGGANLMGGSGSAYGAIVGSALLEVVRNALLMAGIDSNWQGAFVGAFIILAVLIGMETRGFSLRELMRHMFRSGPGR